MDSTAPIALIGYRGTGKTTVAQLLADSLGWQYVDADVEIEKRANRTIAEIFEQLGESGFRDLESVVIADLCQIPQTVIATGGGAILREENRSCLALSQAVIWLRASAAVIESRISADPTTGTKRPNLTNHGGRTEIEVLLEHREPIYRACATLEVDTESRTPVEIADKILAQLSEAK